LIITCKHHETFAQIPVDKLVATLTKVLDFTKKSNDLRGQYSSDIVAAIPAIHKCTPLRVEHRYGLALLTAKSKIDPPYTQGELN
jgi:hypothetical protein